MSDRNDERAQALPRVRVPHPHVDVRADVLAGSPCLRDTRIPVRRLWSWYRGGTSVETLLKRYPQLAPSRLLDALSFALDNEELMEADLAREQAALRDENATRATSATTAVDSASQPTLPFRR